MSRRSPVKQNHFHNCVDSTFSSPALDQLHLPSFRFSSSSCSVVKSYRALHCPIGANSGAIWPVQCGHVSVTSQWFFKTCSIEIKRCVTTCFVSALTDHGSVFTLCIFGSLHRLLAHKLSGAFVNDGGPQGMSGSEGGRPQFHWPGQLNDTMLAVLTQKNSFSTLLKIHHTLTVITQYWGLLILFTLSVLCHW